MTPSPPQVSPFLTSVGMVAVKLKPTTSNLLSSLTVSTASKIILDAISTQGSDTLKELVNNSLQHNFYMELDARIVGTDLLVFLRLMDAENPL